MILKTINSCPSCTSMLTIRKKNWSYLFTENQHSQGLCNKWSSLAPTKYKIDLSRSLVNRAIKICNNQQLLFFECEKITKMLQQNGYSIKIIRNVICKAINRNQNRGSKL